MRPYRIDFKNKLIADILQDVYTKSIIRVTMVSGTL